MARDTMQLEINSWEYSMRKKCIIYSFIVDNPNISDNFWFVGQDPLGEDYLTHSHILGSQNTFGKKYALHIQDIQALHIFIMYAIILPAWYKFLCRTL